MHLKEGEKAVNFALEDIHGRKISLYDFEGKRVLLSFYRDAGCPFCNLRIYELTRYYDEFSRRNLIPVAIFNSSRATIQRYFGKRPRPFPMLADPDQRIFSLYDVRASWGKLFMGFFNFPRMFSAFFRGFGPSLGAMNPLLPADFLIGPDLSVRRAFYAQDAATHIPIKEVFNFLNDRSIGMPPSAAIARVARQAS